jgi:cytochrome c-type biogenesis protein CcmH/NrfG
MDNNKYNQDRKVFESAGAGRYQFENKAMELTLDQEKKKQEKEKTEKKIRRGIWATVIAVALVVSAIFLVTLFMRNRDDEIILRLSDFSFTRRDVNNYARALQDHVNGNPGVGFGNDNLRQVALDDLIWNTALKYYASAEYCNVRVLAADILTANNIPLEIDQGITSDVLLETRMGAYSKNNFIRIKAENIAYQKMLFDCVIATRTVSMVSIYLESLYFLALWGDEEAVQAAYARAYNQLENEFLPMFQAGKSISEIAAMADIDATDPNNEIFKDGIDPFGTKPVIRATIFEHNAHNDFSQMIIDNAVPGEAINLNDIVYGLENIGDYTDVVLAAGVYYTIVRLEDLSNGEFKSWDDFLEQMRSMANLRGFANRNSFIADRLEITEIPWSLHNNVYAQSGGFVGRCCPRSIGINSDGSTNRGA